MKKVDDINSSPSSGSSDSEEEQTRKQQQNHTCNVKSHANDNSSCSDETPTSIGFVSTSAMIDAIRKLKKQNAKLKKKLKCIESENQLLLKFIDEESKESS